MIGRVRGFSRKTLVAASIGAAVLLFATIAGASSLDNGGFERGDLSSWTTANAGVGSWFASQKIVAPLSGLGYFGPAEKNWTAVSDSNDPGSHVLYRLIRVGKHSTVQMFVYYKNHTSTLCSPATLDYTAGCNQQYRIDILRQGADPFSVAGGDVLMNLFHTSPGDPKKMNPNHLRFDLSSLSGMVMLRFAEVDNVAPFNASVDNVVLNNG